jgi:hypothetical protein
MKYYLFCDESNLPPHPYLVYGAVRVAGTFISAARAVFTSFRARHPALSEFKWEYVSGSKPLGAYEQLVDLFLEDRVAAGMGFMCMVSALAEDPNRHSDKVGRDLGFWKAYYTFLANRMEPGCSYNIVVHRKDGPRPNAVAELERYLKYFAASLTPPSHVLSCKSYAAKEHTLLQLADVLSGAVGWEWNAHNRQPNASNAKRLLHGRIVGGLRGRSLKRITRASERQFNVWRWKRQQPEQLALKLSQQKQAK